MRQILAIIGIVALAGNMIVASRPGGNVGESNGIDMAVEDDSLYSDSFEQMESLNDIRFENFEDSDWLDNEYIRTLRAYLDAYVRGEVEDEELDPYRDVVKGQFVIANLEKSLTGGLFIQFMFIDHPELLFTTNVYSTVDVVQRKVVDYDVWFIIVRENEFEVTKDDILDAVKEHPELKLW